MSNLTLRGLPGELRWINIASSWKQENGGLQIVEVAGGYQIVTRPELHEWVRRLFHERHRLGIGGAGAIGVVACAIIPAPHPHLLLIALDLKPRSWRAPDRSAKSCRKHA